MTYGTTTIEVRAVGTSTSVEVEGFLCTECCEVILEVFSLAALQEARIALIKRVRNG